MSGSTPRQSGSDMASIAAHQATSTFHINCCIDFLVVSSSRVSLGTLTATLPKKCKAFLDCSGDDYTIPGGWRCDLTPCFTPWIALGCTVLTSRKTDADVAHTSTQPLNNCACNLPAHPLHLLHSSIMHCGIFLKSQTVETGGKRYCPLECTVTAWSRLGGRLATVSCDSCLPYTTRTTPTHSFIHSKVV